VDRPWLSAIVLALALGMATTIWLLARDVRRRRAAEAALSAEKEQAEVTLHSIGDAVITTDARGVVQYVNPEAQRLTGWTLEEAVGQPITLVFSAVSESDRSPTQSPVVRCINEGKVVGLGNHAILIGRHGQESSIQDSAAPIWGPKNVLQGIVLVFSDVSESRRLANEATHQAAHDPLTGLVNRREFEKRLQRILETAKTDRSEHVVCYADLDQFKVINDTCGHVAGDELLRQLSDALLGQARKRDTFARLGGDEFGVLMEHCAIEQGKRVAETLREAIESFQFI
jgi:PAS domain S-box-containing protein